MNLFAKTELVELYEGDSANLANISDNSIDLTVTSPPYNIGDMGAHVWTPKWYGEIKDALPEEEYQANQVCVLNELYRVTKPDGVLVYNHKIRHRKYQTFHPLQWIWKTEWSLVQEIIWARQTTHNHFDGRLWDTTERIYVLCKGTHPYFNKTCAKYGVVWNIPFSVNTDHPAPFPYEFPRRCIETYSREGEAVLDPYVGSGTTVAAAQDMNRRGIGVDLDKNYLETARQRLQKKGMF